MWRTPRGEDAKIFCLTAAALLWSIFANAVSAPSFYLFGKSAGVSLEFLLTIMLTLRLLDSDGSRDFFLKCVVGANALISLTVVARVFYGFHALNGAMANGNVIGLYSLLVAPFFFGYALYTPASFISRLVLYSLSAATVFCSFSSGAWIAAVFEIAALLLCFVITRRRFSPKEILAAVLFIAVAGSLVLLPRQETAVRLMNRELAQLRAVDDPGRFTTHRVGIWRSALYFIGKRPLTGYGRSTFRINYAACENLFIEKGFVAEDEQLYTHPHNMYLNILYDAGLPAFILFGAALLLLSRKLFLRLRKGGEPSRELMWTVIGAVSVAGQLAWGLSNDVFDQRRDLAVIFWVLYSLLIICPRGQKTCAESRAEESAAPEKK